MVDDSATHLSGRTALVTGGGSGIGRAIAVALSGRGMDVLVVGRTGLGPGAVGDRWRLPPGLIITMETTHE